MLLMMMMLLLNYMCFSLFDKHIPNYKVVLLLSSLLLLRSVYSYLVLKST